MVVSQEQQATRIGLDVLERGGNAVDAAVAVGFALAVSLPKAGNIGGGGFMVVHLAERNEDVAIDYREAAPAATRADVFLDPERSGRPAQVPRYRARRRRPRHGGRAFVGPRALRLGQVHPRRADCAGGPARPRGSSGQGRPVRFAPARAAAAGAVALQRFPSSSSPTARPLPAATSWFQSDLADTLEAIGRDGPRAFYVGPIADKIVAAVRGAGGVMVRGDLENYGAVIRKPVRGTYRGYDIVAMPPPSSGGIHLIEMLNILEGYPSRRSATARPPPCTCRSKR